MKKQEKSWVFNSIQALYKNEDKRCDNREADSIGVVICIKRVSQYLEEKCIGKLRSKNTRIYNSREAFSRLKE